MTTTLKPGTVTWISWIENTHLGKLEHGEFTRISKIERPYMFSFHKTHQTLNLFQHM
jgi:hypothetical protein